MTDNEPMQQLVKVLQREVLDMASVIDARIQDGMRMGVPLNTIALLGDRIEYLIDHLVPKHDDPDDDTNPPTSIERLYFDKGWHEMVLGHLPAVSTLARADGQGLHVVTRDKGETNVSTGRTDSSNQARVEDADDSQPDPAPSGGNDGRVVENGPAEGRISGTVRGSD